MYSFASGRVNEDQGGSHEEYTDDCIESQYIAENLVSRFIVVLAQKDAHDRCSSEPYQCSEGGGKVHQGEGHCQSGDGKRPHAMADEDAVDHVVE